MGFRHTADNLDRGASPAGMVMPRTERSPGHGTHTVAAVWRHHLVDPRTSAKPAARR
jgi:hypothetical protein